MAVLVNVDTTGIRSEASDSTRKRSAHLLGDPMEKDSSPSHARRLLLKKQQLRYRPGRRSPSRRSTLPFPLQPQKPSAGELAQVPIKAWLPRLCRQQKGRKRLQRGRGFLELLDWGASAKTLQTDPFELVGRMPPIAGIGGTASTFLIDSSGAPRWNADGRGSKETAAAVHRFCLGSSSSDFALGLVAKSARRGSDRRTRNRGSRHSHSVADCDSVRSENWATVSVRYRWTWAWLNGTMGGVSRPHPRRGECDADHFERRGPALLRSHHRHGPIETARDIDAVVGRIDSEILRRAAHCKERRAL
jgi:hypothetical protein